MRLALLLGARIRYGTCTDIEKARGDQLLSGLPLLPFDTVGAVDTVSDLKRWIDMQPKCVFLDATIPSITQPIVAFPDVHHFVFINWAVQGLDASLLRERLHPLGYEWVYIDGNMMRFSGHSRVVDVYVGVENPPSILQAIAGFSHLFITDRTPGRAFTDTATNYTQLVVGSTRHAVCDHAFVDAKSWVLLNDKMEAQRFDTFERYKAERDFIVVTP